MIHVWRDFARNKTLNPPLEVDTTYPSPQQCMLDMERKGDGRERGRMDCHWDDVSAAAGMDRCKSDCEMEMNESVQCIPLMPTYPKTIMVRTLQEWK